MASGKLLPVTLAGDPNWVGRITGLALAIRGPLPQPLRICGVVAKPVDRDALRDRVAEWIEFEFFNGTTINTVTGGAEVQELPLPGVARGRALPRRRVSWYARARAGNVACLRRSAALFVIASLVARRAWTWNLARQAEQTSAKYAGKDWHARHLAAEDGPLFAFIEKVRAKPSAHTPAR